MYTPGVVVCATLMLLLPYMPAAMPAAGQDGAGVAHSTTHWSYSPVKTTTKCTTSTKTTTPAKTTAKTTTKTSSTKTPTTTTKVSSVKTPTTTTKASSTKMMTTTTKPSTTGSPPTTTSKPASSSSSSVATTVVTTTAALPTTTAGSLTTTTSSAASSSSSSLTTTTTTTNTTTTTTVAASASCSAAAAASGCVYDVYCDSDYNGDRIDINFATTVDECAMFAYDQAAGAFSFMPEDNICYISNVGAPGDSGQVVAMPGSGQFAGVAPPGSSCYSHPVVIIDPPDDGDN